MCDTNSTPGGICDDYDSSLDQTSGDHWSKISVILKMESAEQISIEVFIALHELARDQLGLQQIDLEGDSTEQDGYQPITSGTSSMNKQAMARR